MLRIWSRPLASFPGELTEPVSARKRLFQGLRPGLLSSVRGRTLRHDLAVIDHRDALRHAIGFFHVVRGEKNGDALGLR